jgi:hypothetical protein
MATSTTIRPPWEAEWHFADWVAYRHRHDRPASEQPLPVLSTQELLYALRAGTSRFEQRS